MRGEIQQKLWTWKERLGNLLRPHYPLVAVGLEGNRVTAVRLERKPKQKKLVLEGCHQEEIAADAMEFSFTRVNLRSPEDLQARLAHLLERVGPAGGPVSVLLPDTVARVNLLAFPELPIRRKDILPMLKFRLQKTIPFRMDEAVLGFDFLGKDDTGKIQVLATVLHRNLLRQFEDLFRNLGWQPGLVDLSSMNLLNLYRRIAGSGPQDDRDRLLVNFTEDFLTLLVVRNDEIKFFRSKGRASLKHTDGMTPRGALRELRSSLTYYRERLGGQGFGGGFLRSTIAFEEEFRQGLEEEIDGPVKNLDLASCLQMDPEKFPGNGRSMQPFLPLIGMALGRRD